MLKEKKKSQRIHDENRMKEKAFKKLYRSCWFSPSSTESHDKEIESTYKMAVRLRDNMAVCSCHMCGNPRRTTKRKSERLTLQEKRFNDRAKCFDY